MSIRATINQVLNMHEVCMFYAHCTTCDILGLYRYHSYTPQIMILKPHKVHAQLKIVPFITIADRFSSITG